MGPETTGVAPLPADRAPDRSVLRSWSGLTESIREGGWLLVAMKVALGGLALYVAATQAVPGPCHFELARNGWTTFPPLDDQGSDFLLFGIWQRWDACWFGKIATWGYEPGLNSVSFLPAFPVLVALVAPFVRGSVAIAGELVAAAAYLVAVVALLRLVGDDFGRGIARRTVFYLTIFPAAFFLFAPFSESLFLAASAIALLGARRQQWAVAGIAALVAALTRTQGVFLALPLAWEAIRGFSAVRDGVAPERWVGLAVPRALAVLAPLLAFAAFVVVATAMTGVSPLDSQDAWGGRNFHAPWDVAAASWQWFLDHADPLQLVNLVSLFGAIALVLIGVRRLPLSYTLLALPQLLLIALRIQPTPLTSTTRYVLVVFPVFVVLALAGRSRRFDRLWTVLSVFGLALLASDFVRGNFVA